MAWLAGQRHQQLTDERMGLLLDTLEAQSLDADQAANVREMRRTYDQAIRLPTSFVETFAQARSEALVAWQQAREASDFEAFKPALRHLIDMTKEKISLLGIQSTPYDVLDEYEAMTGMTTSLSLTKVVGLLQAITEAQEIRRTLPRICV